jgi:diguanylate cyclase (GGDEF)-like protein
MIDLDHFKGVNDRFGHAVGDLVLKSAVGMFVSVLRTGDRLARFGGEEFLVLLPDTGHEGGLVVAERLRASLASRPVDVRREGHDALVLTLTASIGVAELRPEEEAQEFLCRADMALARAKSAGRNRVEVEEQPH